MIGYVTLGTNDLQKHAPFYDAVAQEMGVGRMMDFDTFIAWGQWGGGCGIALTRPFDGQPATVGNGVMVAIEAKDPAQVRRLYDIAMANGGSDEGAPGPRHAPAAFHVARLLPQQGPHLAEATLGAAGVYALSPEALGP